MNSKQTLLERMGSFFPEAVLHCLRGIGELGTEMRMPVHLVGGSVRDLLLGQVMTDLDLVVEGDASQMADGIAQRIGGEINDRSQFGTVKLTVKGIPLDLASARTESYVVPGALPKVAPGTLNDDLIRRDFTINAMVVRLGADTFGELFDPLNGQNDLQRRRVRVLHQNSFRDDASRILRGIRYEQRLDFRLEPDTERLAYRDKSYLGDFSGDRIRKELDRSLIEPSPEKVFRRAKQLGVLSAIHPELDWESNFNELVTMSPLPGSEPKLLLYFALLATSLTQEQGGSITRRFNLPSRWGRVIEDTSGLQTKLIILAKSDLVPSRIVELLEGIQPEALLAWETRGVSPEVRKKINLFQSQLRHRKPNLDGDDLKRLGAPNGPQLGQLLKDLRKAVLDCGLVTRSDERDWIQKRLGTL